jgi:hypothetical protein
MESRWENSLRRDGLKVMKTCENTWLIMPRSEGLPVSECPCCNKPFATQKAAILCADVLFPELGEGA